MIGFLNRVVYLEINGATSDSKCANLSGDIHRYLKKKEIRRAFLDKQ